MTGILLLRWKCGCTGPSRRTFIADRDVSVYWGSDGCDIRARWRELAKTAEGSL